jgi:hypothetical protein
MVLCVVASGANGELSGANGELDQIDTNMTLVIKNFGFGTVGLWHREKGSTKARLLTINKLIYTKL